MEELPRLRYLRAIFQKEEDAKRARKELLAFIKQEVEFYKAVGCVEKSRPIVSEEEAKEIMEKERALVHQICQILGIEDSASRITFSFYNTVSGRGLKIKYKVLFTYVPEIDVFGRTLSLEVVTSQEGLEKIAEIIVKNGGTITSMF